MKGRNGIPGAHLAGWDRIEVSRVTRWPRPGDARLPGRVADQRAVEERDTICCYARQDKFWVTGAPDGERWEIYTVLEDSPSFWGQEGSQGWEAAAVELDDAHGTSDSGPAQCCGTGPADEQAGAAART
jgi:hypothetical protein